MGHPVTESLTQADILVVQSIRPICLLVSHVFNMFVFGKMKEKFTSIFYGDMKPGGVAREKEQLI